MQKTSQDSETPAQGQQVFTACAFIHRVVAGQPKVFLAKRAATKNFLPDVWELPGGHIDFGEDMVVGVKREIMEEFGMRITVGDPFNTFTYMNETNDSHDIEVVFFATFLDPVENIRINPQDHSDCGWFAEAELAGLFRNSIKKIDDDEVQAMYKGLALLSGKPLDFGKVFI